MLIMLLLYADICYYRAQLITVCMPVVVSDDSARLIHDKLRMIALLLLAATKKTPMPMYGCTRTGIPPLF
jgi:hypothetical protein